MYAGLHGLYAMTKKYEFELDEKALAFNKIGDLVFPILEQILDQINSNWQKDQGMEESLHCTYMIVKIFHYCNKVNVQPHFLKNDNMSAWIKYFKNILEFSPPKEMLTKVEDPD